MKLYDYIGHRLDSKANKMLHSLGYNFNINVVLIALTLYACLQYRYL